MKSLLTALVSTLILSASLPAAATKGAEPLQISRGETVNLADYLVPGKTVIFDFTSKYCGPCQTYNEPLHNLHAKRADVVVVKVDINRPDKKGIDWQSPVAQQYRLEAIPHFKVYSPEGKLIAEDRAASRLVNEMISKLEN